MSDIFLGIAVFTGLIMVLALIVLGAGALLRQKGSARLIVNGKQAIMCELGEKLLSALDHGGVHLPTSCSGLGTCGLCRIQVSGVGAGDTVLPIEHAELSKDEIVRGFRLACQTVVRGDLDLTVPPELLVTRSWQCTVKETRFLSPLIKEIVLGLPAGERVSFPAGCYVLLQAPPFKLSYCDIDIAADHEDYWQQKGLRRLNVESTTKQYRAYSVANRPGCTDRLILNIRLALPPGRNPDARPGVVSSYLFSREVGDRIEISGPYGSFFVQDTNCEIIFIGGGVGMAPIYAHVYDQLKRLNSKRKISYWYGARGIEDLYYTDQMEKLAQKYENFSWHVALSDPTSGHDWTGERGFIHDVVYRKCLSQHLAPKNSEYYVCGPPLMIEAVRSVLERLNVPPEKILYDDFGN